MSHNVVSILDSDTFLWWREEHSIWGRGKGLCGLHDIWIEFLSFLNNVPLYQIRCLTCKNGIAVLGDDTTPPQIQSFSQQFKFGKNNCRRENAYSSRISNSRCNLRFHDPIAFLHATFSLFSQAKGCFWWVFFYVYNTYYFFFFKCVFYFNHKCHNNSLVFDTSVCVNPQTVVQNSAD